MQSKLISDIDKCEIKIKSAQELIAGIARRKKTVIKSYLTGKVKETESAMAAEPKMKYKKEK